ncbi:MAG: hypothetical protein IK081_11720 [Lachnospiraceae bacterium]|nr:hypothetical protein [Lachnospiraceae bacterium]
MNRLIKAESYRLGKHISFLVICTVICGLIPVITAINYVGADLGTQLQQSGMMIMAIMMLYPPLFASVAGTLYDQGKLGYYEIMAGNSPFSIVFSKILTDGILFLALTFVTGCGYYIFAGFRWGLGSFDHVVGRLLLLIVALARVAFCSVLILLVVRKSKTGIVTCFMRFWIVDIMVFPFFTWLFGTIMKMPELGLHFSYMSLTNQLMIIITEPIDGMMIVHVLLGFVIEFALWYFIIDLGIRKRKIA